jgi:hypothetical protein
MRSLPLLLIQQSANPGIMHAPIITCTLVVILYSYVTACSRPEAKDRRIEADRAGYTSVYYRLPPYGTVSFIVER